jgi:hypothetical protein
MFCSQGSAPHSMKPFDGSKHAADGPHSGATAPAPDAAHMKYKWGLCSKRMIPFTVSSKHQRKRKISSSRRQMVELF